MERKGSGENSRKLYAVWIYDTESGCNQPMVCSARTAREARTEGNRYIKVWRLRGASVTDVQEIS